MKLRSLLLATAILVTGGLAIQSARAQNGAIESGHPGCPEQTVIGLNSRSVQLYNDDFAPVTQLSDKDKPSLPLHILKCVNSNIFMIDYQGRKLFVFRHQVVSDTKFEITCGKLSGRSEAQMTAGAPAIVDDCKKDAAP